MSTVPLVRTIVIVIIPVLFILLPNIFHRYEDAIAINLGIIAATLLFFGETYYFAIPLILVAAALYKKTKLGLMKSSGNPSAIFHLFISFSLPGKTLRSEQ